MSHNFTQQDVDTPHAFPKSNNNEDEEDSIQSCLSEDLTALSLSEKEVFQQLNEVSYSPRKESVQQILEYGATSLEQLH